MVDEAQSPLPPEINAASNQLPSPWPANMVAWLHSVEAQLRPLLVVSGTVKSYKTHSYIGSYGNTVSSITWNFNMDHFFKMGQIDCTLPFFNSYC